MDFLETKIPPPLVGLIFMGISAALSYAFPALVYDIPYGFWATILLIGLGFGFPIAGSIAFRKFKTTINPLQPKQASTLVTGGVFGISRNPMYVGLALLVLAWALYLSSIAALFGFIGFILYIDRFQIQVEERALDELFGNEFLTYKNSVRRWL